MVLGLTRAPAMTENSESASLRCGKSRHQHATKATVPAATTAGFGASKLGSQFGEARDPAKRLGTRRA